MAYSVKDIIGSVSKNGILSANKFLVRFRTLQNASSLFALNSQNLLEFRAESVRLPDVSFMVSDVNRYGVGPTQKMPYNAMFTDTSITFIADKKSEIYNYFYQWTNKIFDYSGDGSGSSNVSKIASYTTEYKNNYTSDLIVDVYDNNGKISSTFTMVDAFPVSINSVNLDWNNQNTLMKITVGFTFTNWNMTNAQSEEQPKVRSGGA